MSPALWIFASISLVIAILLFLFWYFCSSNIYTKSISTILVILAGLGGSKVAPEYKASFKLNHPILTFDGAISVGGKGTDSIILICVLGIALLVLVSCVTILKLNNKPL